MKRYFQASMVLLAVVASLLAPGTPLRGESSVWIAEKDGRTVYLGGTIHLLRQSDYPLPGEFDEAYGEAALMVFETDIDLLADPGTQSRILAGAMLPDGKSLQDILSRSTYEALKDYCDGVGLPIGALGHYKPSLVMVTLLTIELQKMGVDQEGIDAYYAKRAKEDGKEFLYLETVDDQIGFVLDMGEGNEDDFILHSIEDLKDTPETMMQMIDLWRGGRAGDLEDLLISEMAEEYPQLYRDLIVERNEKWLPQIESYFGTPETEFVLVGAAHLIGDDGLIGSLRKKGYTVEKVR